MRKTAVIWVVQVVAAAMLSWPGSAVGQTNLERFPLLKAVPADSFIVVAARANPKKAFVDDYWAEVRQAFFDSGIMENVWEKITERVPEDQLAAVDELHDRIAERLGRVNWGLLDKEMVYTGRMVIPSTGGLRHEGLIIGRMDAKEAARNFAELKGLLAEFKDVAALWSSEDAVIFKESEEKGVSMAGVGAAALPDLGLVVAQRGDLIFVSFVGDTLLQDALALLGTESSKQRMIDTPRFKEAFANLPPAEDSLVFWDVDGMMRPMRLLFTGIARPTKPTTRPTTTAGVESEEEAVWLGLAGKILDDVSILDYMASVEWTEGRQVFSESVTKLRPEAKASGLGRIMSSGEPVADWSKFVPKEAQTFSVSSGVDYAEVYRYVLDFVGQLPGGREVVGTIEEKLQELGLNLGKDLALLEGTSSFVSLDDGWFLMLKVRDQKKAAARVAELLESFRGEPGKGGMLMVSEAKVGNEEGFRQVSHPVMAYLGGMRPPVIGCAEGYLIVASSAKTAELCLNTGRGKHPNITKSERWEKEALSPKTGPVDSIMFTDETNWSEELQGKITGLSGGFAMAAMMAQGAPQEFRGFMGVAAELLEMLRPVVAKLDFYQSSAAYTTFDGRQWRCREVQNYKSAEARPTSRPTTQPAKPPSERGAKKAESRTAKPESDAD